MKILILCNAGMSSSILTKKIKEASEKQNKKIIVSAKSMADVEDEKGNWDICLVAPQIMYAVENIKSVLNIPTQVIDFKCYAMSDGEKILESAVLLFQRS